MVRTSWLVSGTHPNFVATMLRLAAEREVRVVDDQWGCPTVVDDLAPAAWAALQAGVSGLLHLANTGETTWFRFARAAVALAGLDPGRIVPCTTADYPTPARRPAYSVLGSERRRPLGLPDLPHWEESLPAVVEGVAAMRRFPVWAVVLNHREAIDTLRCLGALGKVRFRPLTRLVVDNASGPGEVAWLRSAGATVVESGGNLGYAGGNNVGIRLALAAGAEAVWVVNPDAYAERDQPAPPGAGAAPPPRGGDRGPPHPGGGQRRAPDPVRRRAHRVGGRGPQ